MLAVLMIALHALHWYQWHHYLSSTIYKVQLNGVLCNVQVWPLLPHAIMPLLSLFCLLQMNKALPKPSGPRLPKMPQLPDYQFFNTKRITEVHAHCMQMTLQHHSHVARSDGALLSAACPSPCVVGPL
jgi:hypothetical protein